MQKANFRSHLISLVETPLLVAVAFVLSYFAAFKLPNGGSFTILSMLPILMIGIRHGPAWGLGGALVYSCLQILQTGLYAPINPTPVAYAAQALLDYIMAYSVLGLAGVFKGKKFGLVYASLFCITLRFFCHFFSGVIVWSDAPWELNAWAYSLTYNGAYMGLELLLTTAVAFVLCKTAPVIFNKKD